MNLAAADRVKLEKLLGDLAGAIEELLLSGLTTASDSTRQSLEVAFREASRMRLLRLGSTLRVANEELGRFTANRAEFSRKRLVFFLNRAWLLSRGFLKALSENDAPAFDRLLWTPASEPVENLEVVTLGVGKKVSRPSSPSNFACAFWRKPAGSRQGSDWPGRASFRSSRASRFPPKGFCICRKSRSSTRVCFSTAR